LDADAKADLLLSSALDKEAIVYDYLPEKPFQPKLKGGGRLFRVI